VLSGKQLMADAQREGLITLQRGSWTEVLGVLACFDLASLRPA
jgi:hypothetical protein